MSGLVDSGSLNYRIFILLRSSEVPLTAGDIAAQLGVPTSAVSSCLKLDLLPTGRVHEDNLYRWSLVPAEQVGSAQASELDDPLAVANQHIETLKKRLADTEWQLEQAHTVLERYRSSEDVKVLYAKVGLTPQCEDHVLRAAHKSFRQKHHPDRFAEDEKKAAHDRFIELEAIFEKLERLRSKE